MTEHLSMEITPTVSASWGIRRAAPQDRPDIERLWREQFDDPDDHDILDEWMPDHTLHEYTQAFLATDGRGRTIGFGIVGLRNLADMAEYTTLDESRFSGRDGYLYLSAVTDAWKRKGIATALFRRRLEWCRDHGANAVYGVAWQNPDGPTSDPLFQKFDFEPIADAPPDYYAGRDCPVCEDECDCTGVVYGREL